MRKWTGLLLAALILVGCTEESRMEGAARDAGQEASEVGSDTVVAEGVIEPSDWSALGFKAAGLVAEVLVEEGQTVQAGDLLVQLDPADAQLAVRQAETALQAAQAQLALLQADAPPQQIAAARAQVEAADAREAQAVAQQDHVLSGPREAEIVSAEARVASALADQVRADDTHDQAMQCFTFRNPYTYEETEVCPGLGPREEQARSFLAAADEALTAARARLSNLQALPERSDVRAAEAVVQAAAAERQAARAQLDLTQAGASQQEIAVAEAEVTRARIALEAAQAALALTAVRAPYTGRVTTVGVEVGNAVVPGQVACVIAVMDQLQVLTKDLSELDVVGIQTGQSVKITLDALPGEQFEGVVRNVALQAEDFRGEAVFPVTVELRHARDAGIRWGMTAWLEFATP